MSVAQLERETVAHGTDLASLVIAYHRKAHGGSPAECSEQMCGVADEVVELDSMFFGADV